MDLNFPDIYVPDDSAPQNIAAANKLADVVEQISGKARVSVIEQPAADPVPERAVLVGYPYSSREYEESLIKVHESGRIELKGVDEYDPDNPDLEGDLVSLNITGYQVRAGTHNAVMRFIHEFLGVVWAWPGTLGTHVPSTGRKTIPVGVWRHRPSAKERWLLNFSRPGIQGTGLAQGVDNWLAHHCAFFGAKKTRGHSFTESYDNEHPDGDPGGNRPELFALQPAGRTGWQYGRLAKMEVGDPAVVDYWFDDLIKPLLDADSHIKTVSCGFNDGHSSGHSIDPRAIAMDYTGPDATPWALAYHGGEGPQYALSDRELRFANRCRVKLNDAGYEHIDLQFQAYGPTRPPPKEAVALDGMTLLGVFNDVNNPDYDGNRQNFEGWLETGIDIIWRPNLGRGHGHKFGLWLTHYREVGERLKDVLGRGCTGFTPDALWEHWSTQWPFIYCMSELLWDHRRTIDEIMDPVYQAMFPETHAHIKAYYEATASVITSNRLHNADLDQLLEMWNDDKIAELQGHLDSAAAAVTGGSVEETRIGWVQAGMGWSKALLQSIRNLQLAELPYEKTSEVNEATLANAAETDVDGSAGWSEPGVHGTISVVSDDTYLSDGYALLFTNNESSVSQFHRDPLPGSSGDTYILEMTVKRVTGDDRWAIRIDTVTLGQVEADETYWQTLRFAVAGGSVITVRNLGNNNGSMLLGRFKVFPAAPIDLEAHETQWQAASDAAISDFIDDHDIAWDVQPISNYARSQIFVPGDAAPGPIDPNLE